MADNKDGSPLDFLLPTGVNAGLNLIGNLISGDTARKNLDYQMDRYYSPQAQVRNLAAAGINPAVAFGNQSPVFTGGGSFDMPQNPLLGIGTQSMTDVANYLTAKANAVKAGADTEKSLAEADAIKLQNDLTREFGRQSWILDVSLKYQNVILAQKTNDIKEQEKAINEFKKATEKAVSQSQGIQRDMLQKRFENLDTELDLQNKLQGEKIQTEKSAQQANKAAANASNTQASVNRETRRLQSALADIEESGKEDKIKSLLAEYKKNKSISDSDAKEADIKLSRLNSIEDKRSSYFFNEVDNFLEWLKGKVSIFH